MENCHGPTRMKPEKKLEDLRLLRGSFNLRSLERPSRGMMKGGRYGRGGRKMIFWPRALSRVKRGEGGDERCIINEKKLGNAGYHLRSCPRARVPSSSYTRIIRWLLFDGEGFLTGLL